MTPVPPWRKAQDENSEASHSSAEPAARVQEEMQWRVQQEHRADMLVHTYVHDLHQMLARRTTEGTHASEPLQQKKVLKRSVWVTDPEPQRAPRKAREALHAARAAFLQSNGGAA